MQLIHFLEGGRAVFGRPAFEDVGDEDLVAAQAHALGDHVRQELAGAADERLALPVFVGARSLTDEHQSGLGRAGAENGLRSRLGQVSALAAFSHDPGQGRQSSAGRSQTGTGGVSNPGSRKSGPRSELGGAATGLRLARRPRQGCGGERLGREQAAFARGRRGPLGGSAAGIGGTAGVSAIAFSSGAAAAALRLGAGGFAGAGTRSSPARASDSSSCRSPRTPDCPGLRSPLGKSGKIAVLDCK